MRAALLSLTRRFGRADFFAANFNKSAILLALPQFAALIKNCLNGPLDATP